MDKEKEHIIADKTMLRVARVTSIVFTPFSIPFLAFLVLFLFSYLRIMPIGNCVGNRLLLHHTDAHHHHFPVPEDQRVCPSGTE